MKSSLIAIFVLLATFSIAQIPTYNFTPIDEDIKISGELLAEPDGNLVYISSQTFGVFDSSYVSFMRIDPDANVIAQKQYTFGPTHIIFYDAVASEEGYVVTGKTDFAFMLKVNADFSIDFIRTTSDVSISSTQWTPTFSEDNWIVTYANYNPKKQFVKRLKMNQGGNNISGILMETVDSISVRFLTGIPAPDAQKHHLAGEVDRLFDNEQPKIDAAVALVLNEGMAWCKRYNFETVAQESCNGLWELANGDLLASFISFNPNQGKFDSYLARLQSNGNPIWTKKLSRDDNVLLRVVTVLADNAIILSGIIGLDQDEVIVKLDAQGNLIWIKVWQNNQFGIRGFNSFVRSESGLKATSGGPFLTLHGFNESGDACVLEDGPAIVVEDYTVVPHEVLFTNTDFDIDIGSGLLTERELLFETTLECNVFPENVNNISLDRKHIIFPNPASDFININALSGIKSQEIQIYNTQGKLEFEGFYSDNMPVVKLSVGLKIVVWQNEEGLHTQQFIKN